MPDGLSHPTYFCTRQAALEAWKRSGRRAGRARRVSLRPFPPRSEVSDHTQTGRVSFLSMSCFLFLHHTDVVRVPAHARAALFIHGWDTTAADRAARAELLRCPLRSVAAVRSRVHASRQAWQAGDPGVASEFHRIVHAAHRRGRKGLRGPVAHARAVGGLDQDLRHHRPPCPEGVESRSPAAAPWLAYQLEGRLFGTWTSARRGQADWRIGAARCIPRIRSRAPLRRFVEIEPRVRS